LPFHFFRVLIFSPITDSGCIIINNLAITIADYSYGMDNKLSWNFAPYNKIKSPFSTYRVLYCSGFPFRKDVYLFAIYKPVGLSHINALRLHTLKTVDNILCLGIFRNAILAFYKSGQVDNLKYFNKRWGIYSAAVGGKFTNLY
jgi:hypothetical protein